MSEETIQLKKRIAELERINAELVRENAALKSNPQPPIQQSRDKSTQILQLLNQNSQAMTTSQVATRLNLIQSLAQYHLDHLVASGFVTLSSTGSTTGYTITPQGREIILGVPAQPLRPASP